MFNTDWLFTDKESVLLTIMKNVDESLIFMNIKASFNVSKDIVNLLIFCSVHYHHNTDRILVIKNVVTVSNKNMINLHTCNRELKNSQIYLLCEIEFNFFIDCVVDISSDSSLSFELCINYIWNMHLNCCSLCEFQFCSFKQ